MKSVKVLLGTVLCLVMLSGQAMATTSTTKTLTFDNVPFDGLGSYGTANHVQFSDEWYLAAPAGNIALQEMSFGDIQSASLQFYSNEPVGLSSFSYIYNIGNTDKYGENLPQITVTAYDTTYDKVIDDVKLDYTNSLNLKPFVLPTEWANYFIGKIEFTMQYGSFTIDNIALNTAPTPVPGAAVLIFSGLLGLVGLRRRQIV